VFTVSYDGITLILVTHKAMNVVCGEKSNGYIGRLFYFIM